MKIKRIIMTGATGFIAIELLKKLRKRNIETISIIRPNSKRKKYILNYSYVIECDLKNLIKLNNLNLGKIDVFFHLGWMKTDKKGRNNSEIQNKNIKCTLDAVKVAYKLGCKKFIGAGSQAEYGNKNHPIDENTPTIPETVYGKAKLKAGILSAKLCKKLGIKHIWTRIFSAYGPYDNQNNLIIYCIDKLLKNEKPLLTKCEQIWDFIYCSDVAEALYLLALKGKEQNVYNIGSGIGKPLKEYIYTIRDLINPKAKLGFGEIKYPNDQVMFLQANIDKLKKDTGFSPKVSFKQGIIKTINWYKKEVLNEKNINTNSNFK